MKKLQIVFLTVFCLLILCACNKTKDYQDPYKKPIEDITALFTDENGYVSYDNVNAAGATVFEYARELASNGEIDGAAFCPDSGSVSFFQKDGTDYVYYPSVEGTNSGGNYGAMVITTLDDAANLLTSIKGNPYWGGKYIYDHCEGYTLLNNITADNGNIAYIKEQLQTLPSDNIRIIFWNGHGNHAKLRDGTDTVLFAVSDPVNSKNNQRFAKDIADEAILICGNTYAVTCRYFEKYLPEVDGGLFISDSCYGAADGGTMARTMIGKGFDCYVGTSSSVQMLYGQAMVYDIAKALTDHADGTDPYCIIDALDYAREQNGSTDPTGTYFDAWCYSNNFKEYFTLIPSGKHYILGSVEAKKASVGSSQDPISGATVTVMDARGIKISNTITDDKGNYCIPLRDSGIYSVQAEAPGYLAETIISVKTGNARLNTIVNFSLSANPLKTETNDSSAAVSSGSKIQSGLYIEPGTDNVLYVEQDGQTITFTAWWIHEADISNASAELEENTAVFQYVSGMGQTAAGSIVFENSMATLFLSDSAQPQIFHDKTEYIWVRDSMWELSDQQLREIGRNLHVPDELEVAYEQEKADYWNAAGVVTYVQISYNGKVVAAATVDSLTGELLKDILVYSDGISNENALIGTWTRDSGQGTDGIYQVIFYENGTMTIKSAHGDQESGYYHVEGDKLICGTSEYQFSLNGNDLFVAFGNTGDELYHYQRESR